MNAAAQIGLLEDEEIELIDAALMLATLDHPLRAVHADEAYVDVLAERLAERALTVESLPDQAMALSALLAREEGFSGDLASYDDPANADLMRMFDRRRGLPITLSLLYVGLARRIDWEAQVLNTPGHVLVRLGHPPDGLIIDPFDHGRIVGEDEIAHILGRAAGGPVDLAPEHLSPLSNRSALVRLLANIATRAERQGDLARALVIHERMTMIAPSFTALWWDRARVEQRFGRSRAARVSLAAMLETTREPMLRARIHMAMAALARSAHG